MSLHFLFVQVSWIRRKDYHLLTIGVTTYSSDERFNIIRSEDSEVITYLCSRMSDTWRSAHLNTFCELFAERVSRLHPVTTMRHTKGCLAFFFLPVGDTQKCLSFNRILTFLRLWTLIFCVVIFKYVLGSNFHRFTEFSVLLHISRIHTSVYERTGRWGRHHVRKTLSRTWNLPFTVCERAKINKWDKFKTPYRHHHWGTLSTWWRK